MNRYLVVFQSHLEGPCDVYFVSEYAETMLGAILEAKRKRPPMHILGPWALVRAWPWPKGCSGVVEAAKRLTGTR